MIFAPLRMFRKDFFFRGNAKKLKILGGGDVHVSASEIPLQ